MRHGSLPPGLTLQRTTDELDDTSVPKGLLRAHQIGPGTWGMLEVLAGGLVFVWEDGTDPPVALVAGDSVVIPPQVRHHVEPEPGSRFQVSFHR